MDFVDAFFPIGRTNNGFRCSPCSEDEALAVMDRYDVREALVYHTLARDANPNDGNAVTARLRSERLHRVWAFESAFPAPAKPADFLADALRSGVKAVLVNPAARNVRIERSPRIRELAALLEQRRIPLLAVYRQWSRREDIIDWYGLADFCREFPDLPVIAWQWRSRANRPLFDALAEAPNLSVSISTIWQSQMTECITQAFGHKRVVFSLGLPELDPRTFQGVLTYADISQEHKQAIAGGTLTALMQEADYDF